MSNPSWKRWPRPDSAVVQALEAALGAARRGLVRSAIIITVNPLREPESIICGELDDTGRVVLIGAMSVVTHKIIKG